MDRSRRSSACTRWPASWTSRRSRRTAPAITSSSIAGRARRYAGTIPPISRRGLADVAQAQLRLDRLARRVPLHAPWTAPDADEHDAVTFETWIRRTARTRDGRALLRLAVEAVWACRRARRLAAPRPVLRPQRRRLRRAGRHRRRCAGRTLRRRLGGCSPSGWPTVSAEAGSGSEAPVSAIRVGDGSSVVVRAGDEAVAARRVVVAVPPTLAGRIAYSPRLPAVRDGLTQRMAQGSVVKCCAIYDDAVLARRRAERPGAAARRALQGPVRQLAALRHPRRAAGVSGRSRGAAADRRGRRAAARRGPACFARVFGPQAAAPERYVDVAWADEEFSRGCYGGYLPPGGWTDFGERAARTGRSDPLGGRRDGDRVERLHGRRGDQRRARSARGRRDPRLLRIAAQSTRMSPRSSATHPYQPQKRLKRPNWRSGCQSTGGPRRIRAASLRRAKPQVRRASPGGRVGVGDDERAGNRARGTRRHERDAGLGIQRATRRRRCPTERWPPSRATCRRRRRTPCPIRGRIASRITRAVLARRRRVDVPDGQGGPRPRARRSAGAPRGVPATPRHAVAAPSARSPAARRPGGPSRSRRAARSARRGRAATRTAGSVSAVPRPRRRAPGTTPSAPIQPVVPKDAQHATPSRPWRPSATRTVPAGETRGNSSSRTMPSPANPARRRVSTARGTSRSPRPGSAAPSPPTSAAYVRRARTPTRAGDARRPPRRRGPPRRRRAAARCP